MIILGGEPPVEPTKDPHLGGLLSSLNNLRYKLENQVISDNQVIQNDLNYLAQVINQWVIQHQTPADQHIAAVGAMHSETASTVKLEKVDNFRTALIPSDYDNRAANAFVTPLGLNKTVASELATIDLTSYQRNTRLPMALLHHIDQFKRAAKDPWTVPYFTPGPCTLIMNGDRVIVSPQYPTEFAGPYSMFYSDTVKSLNTLSLNEERMLATYYMGTGWNMKGAVDSVGQVGLFRPLANKGIYDYNSNLPANGNRYVVLSSTFGDITHKGCLISCAIDNNNTMTLTHYFFGVADPENNPTLNPIIGGGYLAVYNTVNNNNGLGPLNNTRQIKVIDFFTTGNGVRVESALAPGVNPTITADWRVQDKEFLMNIALPVKVTIGNNVFNKILTWTESVHPGRLVINDLAGITSLIPFTPDVINNVDDLVNSKWLVDQIPNNLIDLISSPGVINNNGLAMNSFATRTSIRLKLTQTGFNGIIPVLVNPKLNYPATKATTQIFAPTRHLSFGALAERIIPISNSTNETIQLSYSLANNKGGYGWKELSWGSNIIYSSGAGLITGFNPLSVIDRNIESTVPASLTSTINDSLGVLTSGLCFTPANQFKGLTSVSYSNGGWNLGSTVTLTPTSTIVLNTHLSDFTIKSNNAAIYGGNANSYQREFTYSVYTLPNSRALCVWSDGVGYVEALITMYTLTGNTVVLNLSSSDTRSIVSANVTPSKGNRVSVSDDNLYSYHQDLLVYQQNNTMYFCLNRAFGKVAGDCSFRVFDYTVSKPTLTPSITNAARLYAGTALFDVADELYAPIPLNGVGIYQNTTNTSTQTLCVAPTSGLPFDPYVSPNAKSVIISEGFRCIINGLAIKISNQLEKPYNTFPCYFYLEENFGVINLNVYSQPRTPDNNAILVATDLDGTGVVYNRSYLVLDRHLISSDRHSSTIPMVIDDGSVLGSTKFFQYADVIRDR